MSHSNLNLNLNQEDYNWLKTLTDGPNLQRTIATTIALSLDPHNPNPYTRDIEPPPHIDYWLVHGLIRLSERVLTDLDKKRYDQLSAARRAYYAAHSRFHHAYHGLADTQAYERILDAERSEMYALGERREGQWAESERQKEGNARDLVRRLEEVRRAAELRRAMTGLLGREKRAFLERDGLRLAFLCRHAFGQWRGDALTGMWGDVFGLALMIVSSSFVLQHQRFGPILWVQACSAISLSLSPPPDQSGRLQNLPDESPFHRDQQRLKD